MKAILITSAALLSAASMPAALAQSSDSTGPQVTLKEVVVTAEKRKQSLESVPMSITAITASQLQEAGASSLQDVASSVPSLAFRSSGPGRMKLTLRGVSSSAGVSSTVGYYIDETAISSVSSDSGTSYQQTSLDPDLFDVKRIEILRGPQGTLYGSGSMGGTVRIITNKPALDHFEGVVNAQGSYTAHGGENGGANAVLNLPLVDDQLAWRTAISFRHDDGYINRLVGDFQDGGSINSAAATPGAPGASPLSGVTLPARAGVGPIRVIPDVNTETAAAARTLLLWQVNPDFSIEPGIFWQKTSQGGKNSFDTIPGDLDQRRDFNVAEPYNDTFTLYSLTAKYAFTGFSVLSATGFADRRIHNTEDATDLMTYFFGYYNQNDSNFLPDQRIITSTGQLATLGNLFTNTAYPASVMPYPAAALEANSDQDFTEEFRLSSTGSSPLSWTVGAFYEKQNTNASHTLDIPGYSAAFPMYAQLGQVAFGPGGWPWGDTFGDNDVQQHIQQTAGFGQADYRLTQKLTVTLGARYFDYSYRFLRTNAGLFYGGGTALTGEPITGDTSGNAVTPKAVLSYRFTPDSELYLSAAKGSRIGASNSPVPADRCAADLAAIGQTNAPQEYRPDNLWDYEVGSKNRLLNGRVTLNADVYDIEWKNIQQQVTLPDCGFSFATNVGNARSRGTEIELNALPLENLNVTAGLGYTDAKIVSATPDTGVVVGDRLLDVPKVTGTIAAEYFFSGFYGSNGSFRVSWNYVGNSLDDYTQPIKPAYRMVDARLGFSTPMSWDISIFGNNLLDERPIYTRIDTLTELIPLYERAVTGPPRTIGISVTRRF